MIALGQVVRCVSRTDDTLEEEWLGRVGIVKDVNTYQACGDKPPEDPFIIVAHGPFFGRPAQVQLYWTEEIESLR